MLAGLTNSLRSEVWSRIAVLQLALELYKLLLRMQSFSFATMREYSSPPCNRTSR